MATVWAFREGVFRDSPGTGWSHTIEFGKNAEGTKEFPPMQGGRDAGINDLIDKLEENRLRGSVERLAIVVHGIPGAVYMSGRGRREAIPPQFRDLATYLKNNGMLEFTSCNAGKGPQGTLYLMEISRQLPNRVIVGYSIWGFYEQFPNDPGNVQESINMSRPPPGTPRLAAWGAYAKWAHKGQIVRVPMDEQKDARNRRCANPNCGGHASNASVVLTGHGAKTRLCFGITHRRHALRAKYTGAFRELRWSIRIKSLNHVATQANKIPESF